jgi:predicted metal-dependent hydrolase
LENGVANVEEAIWRILLKEGKSYLPGRVRELAGANGFKITGIKVRQMKTRWGSCTAKNSINLNSWLMMLPDHLVDYVILHELVHTIHRNHSPAFWETLDKLTPGDSKQLRKELRQNRIMSIDPEN